MCVFRLVAIEVQMPDSSRQRTRPPASTTSAFAGSVASTCVLMPTQKSYGAGGGTAVHVGVGSQALVVFHRPRQFESVRRWIETHTVEDAAGATVTSTFPISLGSAVHGP